MDPQREATKQVSTIEDIPDNTTEGQGHGSEEKRTQGWSWSPMHREKVQPDGNVWSWSPFQTGMSSHHPNSGWSWSPITNVQHKHYGRWSWSPSQLKILPYATQEQSDVQGQSPLSDVNCWPVFVDTYRSKRKRTRKRRSKKFGPYSYKRERNWKTLTYNTGPIQGTESQALQNTEQCDSYSVVSEMTISPSQTQKVSNICPQREINTSCLRSTGVNGVQGRSASPVTESIKERNVISSLQNNNEMPSKCSLDTDKKSEEQTLSSIYQVNDEEEPINNSSAVYENSKSEGMQSKPIIPASEIEEKNGTHRKISLPLSERDRMSDINTIGSSMHNADQSEKVQACSLENDKVNNLLKTLSSQSKFAATNVSRVQVNDSSLPHDSIEMMELHEEKLCQKFVPALDEASQTNNQTLEFKESEIPETAEKSQAEKSEMEGLEKSKPSLPEMEKGYIPQPQNISPPYETDETNSFMTDGNNLFTTRTYTINNKKTELVFSEDRGAEEEDHSLSQARTLNTSQNKSRTPSPVDKLISGGLRRSLSFELLDTPGVMGISTDSSRKWKQLQESSTTSLSGNLSPKHSTLMSPNEKNATQVYSNDLYPGSFSPEKNCVNLERRASLLYEKKSSTAFFGCPSVKQDSTIDGALENIHIKPYQTKEVTDAIIHCESEPNHSLMQEDRRLENSISNEIEENEKNHNVLSSNKNASEPQNSLTRTQTLTLPCTVTGKLSSVSISDTKSTTPVYSYERFECRKTEDCKLLVEELELISKKSSSSSQSDEKSISVLQKDLSLPLISVDSCHVRSHHGVLTNKNSGSDLEADTLETTSLLQKNMTSTLDSDSVIAETETLSVSPQNEVKSSAMEFMSTEPKSSSPTKGLSSPGSRSVSPAEKPEICKSMSPSPADKSIPCESRSSFLDEGRSPRESKSPSEAKGVSPKRSRSSSPGKGPLLQGTKNPLEAETLSETVSSSSLIEESPLLGSKSPSSIMASSSRGSRSPSPIEGSSPWRSKSAFDEGSLLWRSRSPSLTKGFSPWRSRSPSPAKVISPRESRSGFLEEGPSPEGSRSSSPARGFSLQGFKNTFSDKGFLPQESKSPSPNKELLLSRNSSFIEGPTPHGSKSQLPVKESSHEESRSPSPAKELFPIETRSPSLNEGSPPRESRSLSPDKESFPKESKSPSPIEGSSHKEYRTPLPAMESFPMSSRSSSPVEGTSHKQSSSPCPALCRSKSPNLAKGLLDRVSRSSPSVEGDTLDGSESSSPTKGFSHHRSISTMSSNGHSPQESRSSSAGRLSFRVSRSLSLTEGHLPHGLKNPFHVEGFSTWESKSPSLAEEPSPHRSRSPSPNKGLSVSLSRSLSLTEGPTLVGPENPYLPDFKSLQLVANRAVTLHSKVEASNVWCKVSSRYFHPNDKTQTPPTLSETVNIQMDIACHSKPCNVAASRFQELADTNAKSGVKRKHRACSKEEVTIDNSQQRKKIATDPTETLNAILRKIHGGSILEYPTSRNTVCRKSVVTRAVTRRLAHRSPNHDLHHVTSARMEIFEAIQSGDFEKVQELMQDTGPAVRQKDTHCTLLHEAVNHRQVDMVLFFLKYISPNVVNGEGSTPAHLAARKGHTQILRLLLADSEMDPNKRDHFNNTYKNWLTLPLLEAVVGDNRARVQELLRLGAEPDYSAEPPEDWFADRNMKITTARQLADALQRDNILTLFKRKSIEDDLKSAEDVDVDKALPALLFPKENNDMDNEFTQLVHTSLAVTRGPDVYRMDAAPRGYVCILSYGSFHDRPDLQLQGSQTDAHNLADTFSKMGYLGHAHFSLTADQTRQQLAKVRDMELLRRAGCAVFIISSHGEPRRHFLTSDMQTIDVQWVLDFFKDSQCPYLRNKPKLFIWDLCRGHQGQESGRGKINGELCGRMDEPLRDVMCLDSSSGGFTWHAFSEEGTPFIGALCSVMARHSGTKELIELYREFLKEYATAAPDAVPQLTNYGFNKKFFFN